ncbi:hypothetical protein [Eubacterium sp.]|uniref:hypothetical protein n=1 Tax=Eubacterium sp. TaxID=142586 RepID=UPI0039A0CE05
MIKSQKTKRMMAVLITLVIIAGIMPVDLRSNVVAEEVSETTTVKPTETQIKETTTVEETTTEAPKDIPDLVEDKKIIQGTKREYNPDKERETYPVIILNDQAEDFSKYKFSYHVKTEEEIKNVDLDNTKLKYVSEMPTIDNRVQVKKIIVKVSREGYLDRYFEVEAEITPKNIEEVNISIKKQLTYDGSEQNVVEGIKLKEDDKYKINWKLTDKSNNEVNKTDYKEIKIKAPGLYKLEVEISREGFNTLRIPYTIVMNKGTISMDKNAIKMFNGSYKVGMSENAIQDITYPENGTYEIAGYGVKKPGENEYKYVTECPKIDAVKTGNYEYAVKIKRTDDDNYEILEITGLKIDIRQASQKIEFVDIPTKDVVFNDNKTIDISVKAIGEDGNELTSIEDIKYSLSDEGKKIAEINEKTGELTFTGVGEIEVIATTEGTENYSRAEVKTSIKIVWAEIDFDKDNVLPKEDYKDDGYKWYNDSVELSVPSGAKWTMISVKNGTTGKDWQESSDWSNTIKLNDAEKYNEYQVVFKNDKGEITAPYTIERFAIDNKSPEVTQFKFEKGNDKTYGLFINEALKVKVTVKDDGTSSGIKQIHLYKYAADAKTVLTEDASKYIEVVRTDDGKSQYEATFEINVEPNFKGYLRATVEDNVGHESEVNGPNKGNSNIENNETGFIILENKAPIVSDISVIPFDNVSQYFDNEKYIYNGDVKMHFTATDEDIDEEFGDMGSGIFQVNAKIDTAKSDSVNKIKNGIYTALEEYGFTTENIIPNENGEYKVNVIVTDNAGNITKKQLKIAKDTAYPIITGFEFTPENNMDVEKDGNLYKAVEPTDYGFYFKDDVKVTVFAQDFKQNNECKSDVDTITYETVDVSGKIVKRTVSVDKEGKISFVINKDFKGQIYAYATDKVGNSPLNKLSKKPTQADAKYPSVNKNGYVHPDGTIVEGVSKHKETSFIKIKMPNTNKSENIILNYNYKGKAKKDADMDGEREKNVPLYNYEPTAEIVVSDKYSGVRRVKYVLTEGDKKTQSIVEIDNSGNLKNDVKGWKVTSKDKNVVTEMSNSMRLSGNYNNMVLLVELTDRAGNVSYDYVKFGIDKTAPTIDVTYNNNSVNNGRFFKNNRIATITVTERNFNEEDFKYKVTKNGKKQNIKLKWKKVKGKGNKDNEKYISKIKYTHDGDYTFNASYKDLAGNKCRKVNYKGIATGKFTIDKTRPSISVSYDNNSAQNGKYFKEYRTATVVVTEHNFDASSVKFKQTASLKGSRKSTPSVNWSSNGDTHTAKIAFNSDGDYTFDVTMNDRAGNQLGEARFGSSVAAKEFTIDTKIDKPTITGVENGKSYRGKVIPKIKFNDTNYSGNEIKLTCTRMGKKDVDVTKKFIKAVSTSGKGGTSVSDTFKNNAGVDGIYTLIVKMVDKAGNKSDDKVKFTVNRYGSVYELDDYLTDINDGYIKSVDKSLIITEYNPDKLENNSINVQLTKDGSPIKNVKYSVNPVANDQVKKGESGWYQYEYKIDALNFKNDGIYKIVVSSKDKAGNKPESTNYKDSQIKFRVDTTSPDISSVVGLEKAIVNADSQNVKFEMFDSIGLKFVKVYVDGKVVKTINKFDDLSQCADEIKLKEGSNQKVRLLAEDMAGNITDTDSKEFKPQYAFNNSVTISTNFFVRWYANKLAFWGTITGLIILVGGAWVLIMMKKKKQSK